MEVRYIDLERSEVLDTKTVHHWNIDFKDRSRAFPEVFASNHVIEIDGFGIFADHNQELS